MAWEKLGPVVKVSHNQAIKAWVRVRKDGTTTLSILITDILMDEFPIRTCFVYFGTDDDEGRLQLKFVEDGDVTFSRLGMGGWRVVLARPRFVEEKDAATEACKLIDRKPDSITFALPLDAWKGARPKGKSTRTEVAAPNIEFVVVGAPGSGKTIEGYKIDAVRYLSKKGHDIKKSPQGDFWMGGTRVEDAVVLEMINRHRKVQGLELLTLAEIE